VVHSFGDRTNKLLIFSRVCRKGDGNGKAEHASETAHLPASNFVMFAELQPGIKDPDYMRV
jgi:hypothetical protein